LFADGVYFFVTPLSGNMPATDLYNGLGHDNSYIAKMNISRHGNPPIQVPRDWPSSSPLPGAVNVAFFDGHAQAVKLDALWQLYWHVGYLPPAKRPGLP
jgi:prepilin-type processing-associated H-X9-DG protein